MRLYLAPMEGVIDHHLRRLLCSIGGLDMCVTEFVRVTDHRLPARVFYKYCPEMQPDWPDDLGCPIKLQLLGSNPQALAENAGKAARLGAAGIDLNFGCPAKTVNRHRGGACLLDEPELVYEIVRRVRDAVPANIPVTAKIRLGFNDREPYLRNARAIAEAGATELVVHARSKADGYRPPAHWHLISDIKREVAIPVIANGEIWSLADYQRCRTESGCDDVMLGRGVLACPDLPRIIKAHLQGTSYTPMQWHEILAMLWHFHMETLGAYPKKHIGNRLKQWLVYLRRTYAEAGPFFEDLKRERTAAGIEAAFHHAGLETRSKVAIA